MRKIHGIRIYPQSLEIEAGEDAAILVHGSVSEECSDFFYIFRPIAALWQGHFFANSFTAHYAEKGLVNPLPGLKKEFGPSFVAADVPGQLVIFRGDGFEGWGAPMYFFEGAFLPVFRERPSFELLKGIYWSQDTDLSSATWPEGMRALLHMWDDIYWELYSTERADIEALLRAHARDPKLKIYFVDFDREFPDPSGGELQAAED